jgi:hypothetical protein
MNPARGFACINELEFGVPLKPAMSSIFRLKLAPASYRSLVLEAHRFGGQAAVDAGIADRLGGLDAVLDLVKERKLTGKAKTGIYGLLKAEMYRESVALLSEEGYAKGEEADMALAESEDKRREEAEKRLEGLKAKAKL